jgi:hypothetical protein
MTDYRIWNVGINVCPEDLPEALTPGKAVKPGLCHAAKQILFQIETFIRTKG